MENLDEALFDRLMGLLSPKECASLSGVCVLFRWRVERCSQWKAWCYRDFPRLARPAVRDFIEEGITEAHSFKSLYNELSMVKDRPHPAGFQKLIHWLYSV